MTIKYTKLPQNIPNGRKNIPNGRKNTPTSLIAKPPHFTKINIFGFKIYHLATHNFQGL
jgi:hypothetical protein